MKIRSLAVLGFLFATMAWASSSLKYAGDFTFMPNPIHKDGVKCQVQLFFDDNQLSRIAVHTEKPIFGKSDFNSSEQEAMTATDQRGFHLALIYKLVGPPHKWYYVFVGVSGDQGRTFSGNLYKAPASMGDIKNALGAGGSLPSDWKQEGTGDLKTAP